MELSDTRIIAADRATVWAALLDPEVLKACVPGCESVTGAPDTGFEAVVVQKVGPVKARFTGVITLSDIVKGTSLRITGEGKGGPAGFAKGAADVMLSDAEGGTGLAYSVKASVGGKIAQLGSRLIDGFARRMADEFFERFQATLEAPDCKDATAAVGEEAEPAEAKKGWFKRIIG